MQPDPTASPSDLLQATMTTAGLVFGIAALVDAGPTPAGINVVSVALLGAGICSLAGAAYALFELGRREGLGWRDLFASGWRSADYPDGILTFVAWGLLLLTVAYVALVADASP
jgi:hypothetical protein